MNKHAKALHVVSEIAEQQHKNAEQLVKENRLKMHIVHELDHFIQQFNSNYHVLMELNSELILMFDDGKDHLPVCWFENFDPAQFKVDETWFTYFLMNDNLDINILENFKKQAIKLLNEIDF